MTDVTDRLEYPIDPGIMGAVIALNANDIHTAASCEGHLDHGAAYPWVDIRSGNPQVDEVRQKIAVLLSEGKRGSKEVEHLQSIIHQLNYQEELKLMNALDAFYEHHRSGCDQRLIFWHDTTGGCRVQSQGADTQEIRPPDERTRKLKEYQDEMHAFADFLKRRYFGEKTEYTTQEAGDLLGVQSQTLTRQIEKGHLQAEKRGGYYVITASALEKFRSKPRRAGRPAKSEVK